MRVVYYTRTGFLDMALSYARALSPHVELHLIVELAPESWQRNLFDMRARPLRSGVVPASTLLDGHFPPSMQSYWKDVASFSFAVHHCRRSIHPATWWVSHKVVRHIADLRPDVVHLDSPSLRVAWAVPELRNVATVMSIHDPEAHPGQESWKESLAEWLTLRQACRFILYNARMTAAFCEQRRVSPDQVDVVPLGVYDIYRSWGSGAARPRNGTVLFFGRLAPYKGLDVLYAAAPLVAAKVPGVRFVVAGLPSHTYDPPSPPRLPRGGTIDVLQEYIGNDRLAALFEDAAVVVCPYTQATQSGVVLTAYAFGTPVIASRVGGLPDYVVDGDTGLLVPPGDAQSLADAITRVLTDDSLRARLAHGADTASTGPFAWSTSVQRALGAYEHALA